MKRPPSSIVFGILNIGWALLGILGLVLGIITLNQPNNPMAPLMRGSSATALWLKGSMPLGILMALVLLLSGIGLLRLKPWGRSLALFYGVAEIGLGVIGLIFHFGMIVPGLLAQLPMANAPEVAMGIMGGVVGGTLGGLVNIAYSVLLVVFMKRPNVVAAFSVYPPALRA